MNYEQWKTDDSLKLDIDFWVRARKWSLDNFVSICMDIDPRHAPYFEMDSETQDFEFSWRNAINTDYGRTYSNIRAKIVEELLYIRCEKDGANMYSHPPCIYYGFSQTPQYWIELLNDISLPVDSVLLDKIKNAAGFIDYKAQYEVLGNKIKELETVNPAIAAPTGRPNQTNEIKNMYNSRLLSGERLEDWNAEIEYLIKHRINKNKAIKNTTVKKYISQQDFYAKKPIPINDKINR